MSDTLSKGYTAPYPAVTQLAHRHFVCTMPAASMIRTDGKRLDFIHGYFVTNDINDISYITAEISVGNMYVRDASPDEIKLHAMRIDLVGTIKNDMRPDIEAEITERLTRELLDKFNTFAVGAGGTPITPDQMQASMANNSAANIDGIDSETQLQLQLQNATQSGSGRMLGGISGTDKNNVNAANAAR